MSRNEDQIDALRKEQNTVSVDDMHKNLEAVSSADSAAQFNALKAILEKMKRDLDTTKKELGRNVKTLEDAVYAKADKADLAALEKMIMDRLNQLVNELGKKFAEKGETKRAIKGIERQLKNLFDIIMANRSNKDEEDAMFAKKPLGGWSCASCQKNLVNLQGQMAEFTHWNKLPVRDPSERIAKVGQGFSKMLSMLRPQQEASVQQSLNQSRMATEGANRRLQNRSYYEGQHPG